jgi:hypothetical protein
MLASRSDMVPIWNMRARTGLLLHWDGLNGPLREVVLSNELALLPRTLVAASAAGPRFGWLDPNDRVGVRLWYVRVLPAPRRVPPLRSTMSRPLRALDSEEEVLMALGLIEETVAADEAALTAEFIEFLKDASAKRYPTGTIRRFNQGRAAGCVEAEFTVRDDLALEHRVGLFAAPRTYHAFIRFANATSSTDREKDTRGMAITLSDVVGANLTPGQRRQDFILNSHPVMVAPDAREFLELLRANEAGGLKRILYFATHPKAARTGFASRQHPTCHLDIPYWSTTPYSFGHGRAVKYYARPSSQRTSKLPDPLTDNYLHEAMKAHLQQADASFDFYIQFHVDDLQTPIEDATIEWKESVSPYVPVAGIRIPPQTIADPERVKACEEMAFNPWHALEEHRPLGSMNRARNDIYRALSDYRLKSR